MTAARRGALVLVVALGLPPVAHGQPTLPREHMLCLGCHDLHEASYPALLGQLCEACHVEGGPAPAVRTHSSRTTDNGYGNWEVDCWGCHEPHEQAQDEAYGTTYGKLLRVRLRAEIKEIDPADPGPYWEPLSILRTVESTSLRFTGPSEYVDGDAESADDMCQVCHLQTAYYEPSAALATHADFGPESQPGGDCSSCHSHANGFAVSCIACHSEAQPPEVEHRRQVAGAGGDFARLSHHVTDGSAAEVIADADCEVCHAQSSHQGNAEPTVLLFDADDLTTTYAYDGTGASVEGFCLSCHDADSSAAVDSDANAGNGNQPFSDGHSPADIATTWAAAGHNAPVGTTVGDEGCMACHGGADATRPALLAEQNAHGSANAALLSSVVNGVSVANHEEALCYACHDGEGATTDLVTELGKGANGAAIYHHPVVDGEQVGGRTVECADCHDPHAATASEPWLGVVGVAIDGSSVASALAEYEVCLRCHGDTYNAGRSRTTNKRIDFGLDNGSYHPVAQPGRNASSNLAAQLLGGLTPESIIACSDCHNSDATSDVPGPAAGSAWASRGPHGSSNPFILRAPYWTDPVGRGSYLATDFALCFLCHDEALLVGLERVSDGARTNFVGNDKNLHYSHVVAWSDSEIVCANCHYNTHGNQSGLDTSWVIDGVEYATPPVGAKTRGVSFSPDVLAVSYTRPAFEIETSSRKRTCSVDCHGKRHPAKAYTPGAGDDDPLTY